MLILKVFRTLLIAGFLALSSGAYASTTTEYDFGVLVKSSPYGYSAPTPLGFAHLTKVDDGLGNSDFTLSILGNLFSNFGTSAYVRGMGFDYATHVTPTITYVDSNVTGMTVKRHEGWPIPGMTIDFGTVFKTGGLGDNKWVEWTASGLGIDNTIKDMYVYIANINNNPESTAKYAPVPEPEAYAMLLLGLGMLGLTTHLRRKNKQS